MARHNIAFLLGTVKEKPIIKKNEEGELLYAELELYTGVEKDGKVQIYSPLIISREPKIMIEMDKWQKNDAVQIKGPISCAPRKKLSICPFCGCHNILDTGVAVYITPIFTKKLDSPADLGRAKEFIKENRSVSNRIYLFGTMCTQPICDKNGEWRFQTALNRKYLIRTDSPDVKTDYPWIKTNDLKEGMIKGSSLYVEGYLRTNELARKSICCECLREYEWHDRQMEIVPFETEVIYEGHNQKFGSEDRNE